MRTSLNNIKAIDDYIMGRMAPGDVLLLQAGMLLNSDLKDEIKDQQNAHAIIRHYSRQRIKNEIIAVQNTFTTARQYQGFMQRIVNLFI